jgi:hypothetical protein
VPCLTAGKMHLCQPASILEYLADALGKFKAADGGFDLATCPSVSAWMRSVQKPKGFGTPEQVLPKESRA